MLRKFQYVTVQKGTKQITYQDIDIVGICGDYYQTKTENNSLIQKFVATDIFDKSDIVNSIRTKKGDIFTVIHHDKPDKSWSIRSNDIIDFEIV